MYNDWIGQANSKMIPASILLILIWGEFKQLLHESPNGVSTKTSLTKAHGQWFVTSPSESLIFLPMNAFQVYPHDTTMILLWLDKTMFLSRIIHHHACWSKQINIYTGTRFRSTKSDDMCNIQIFSKHQNHQLRLVELIWWTLLTR